MVGAWIKGMDMEMDKHQTQYIKKVESTKLPNWLDKGE